MKTLPISDYQDAVQLSAGFSAVRAYDPDQVDGQCIQTPYCLDHEWAGYHSDVCPVFQDNSHGFGEDSYGNDTSTSDTSSYGYEY